MLILHSKPYWSTTRFLILVSGLFYVITGRINKVLTNYTEWLAVQAALQFLCVFIILENVMNLSCSQVKPRLTHTFM